MLLTLVKYLERTAVVLALLVLFQSCQVYHMQTSSKEEALKSNDRVKIKMKDGKIYKFKNLMQEEDQLFGIMEKFTIKGDPYQKILLNEKEIRDYYLKEKSSSILATILASLAFSFVFLGILAIIFWTNFY